MNREAQTVNPVPRGEIRDPLFAGVQEILPEEHQESFGIFFDHLNDELMRPAEGNDRGGIFVWESTKSYPGVKFLAVHIRIKPEWAMKIAARHDLSESASGASLPDSVGEPLTERRINHYIRFIQPALGKNPDGSGLSPVDMALSPALDMLTIMSAAIARGEEPPSGEIFILGSPTALGGETTETFNTNVRKAKDAGEGFGPYGEIYAEFEEEFSPKTEQELDRTRIVEDGAVSKGAITTDKTFRHLPERLQDRTVLIPMASNVRTGDESREYQTWIHKGKRGPQMLLGNPAGVHGHNLPTKIGRSLNMLPFPLEGYVRGKINPVARSLDKPHKQFYKDVARELGIPEESEEQKRLKADLFNAELATLFEGSPIDKSRRSFVRISSPDTANANLKAVRKVIRTRLGRAMEVVVDAAEGKPRPRRAFVFMQEGNMSIFPNANKLHMLPWIRSINSGAWARKMAFIENTNRRQEKLRTQRVA